MIRLSRSLAAFHQQRLRDEGGFALIAVLAVIALTSITIGALLGLSFVTIKITSMQEQLTRDLRAADGAIEAAVTQLRHGTEDCESDPQGYLRDMVFDQGTPGTGDDVNVTVECRFTVGLGGHDKVQLVGSAGYVGNAAWTTNCTGANVPVGCIPWSKFGGVPSDVATNRASLIHAGHAPLQFDSSLTVRRGAAVARTDMIGSDPAYPSVRVGGQYRQGAPGYFANGTDTCGMLSGEPGNRAGLIEDIDNIPECEDAYAQGISPDLTQGQGLIAIGTPVVPAQCPDNTNVVSFEPGVYTPDLTAQVNRLISNAAGSGCSGGRTFWFKPGIFEFQGDLLQFGASTGGVHYENASFVFGEPLNWSPPLRISSTTTNGTLLTRQPELPLCDVEKSGTSLVIAGHTRIEHRGGRVALCPAMNGLTGHHYPAIYQQSVVPAEVTVTGAPLTRTLACEVPSFELCPGVAQYDLHLSTFGGATVRDVTLLLTGKEGGNEPNNFVRSRLTRFEFWKGSSRICGTNWIQGMPNGGLVSAFRVTDAPAWTGLPSCHDALNSQSQGILNGVRVRVIHQATIWDWLRPSIEITDAQIQINGSISSAASGSGADWSNASRVLLRDESFATPNMGCAGYACAVADPSRSISPSTPFRHEVTVSGFAPSALPAFADAEVSPNVLDLQLNISAKPEGGAIPTALFDLIWEYHLPKLEGWFGENVVAPILNAIKTYLQSALHSEHFLPEGSVTARLDFANGDSRCVRQGLGINSSQVIALDLLDPNLVDPSAPNCGTYTPTSVDDLDDVSVTLGIEMPCVRNWQWGGGGQDCLRSAVGNETSTAPVWQLRPPSLDAVDLVISTDAYEGRPVTSMITVDSRYSATTEFAQRTIFNVYGKAWMPFSDINIHWKGQKHDGPLFADELILNGLASYMNPNAEMGVVCCSAESNVVELIAIIDGNEILRTTVEFQPDSSSPTGLSIPRTLNWTACRGNCSLTLYSVNNSDDDGP